MYNINLHCKFIAGNRSTNNIVYAKYFSIICLNQKKY